MNATFVQPAADATFVAPTTAGLGQANETFQVEAAAAPMKILIQSGTMVLDRPAPEATARNIPSMNSIMTDDISDEEATEAVVVATPQNQRTDIIRSAAKNNKELFK